MLTPTCLFDISHQFITVEGKNNIFFESLKNTYSNRQTLLRLSAFPKCVFLWINWWIFYSFELLLSRNAPTKPETENHGNIGQIERSGPCEGSLFYFSLILFVIWVFICKLCNSFHRFCAGNVNALVIGVLDCCYKYGNWDENFKCFDGLRKDIKWMI